MSYTFHRRVAGALALVGAVALALASPTSAAEASGQSVVKWAITFPATWDPVTTNSHNDQYDTNLIYEPLLEVTPQGEPAPGLAQSWAFDATGTTLKLNLRPDAKFTDGTPVDSTAIKAFFDRSLNEADSARKVDFDAIKSVTIDSQGTVTLNLKRPDYGLLLRLGPKAGQVPSPAVSGQNLAQGPVGAGPFKVSEFVANDHVFLEKNPDYWDAKNINIDKIEIYPAPSPAESLASVTSGQYDLVTASDNSEQAQALASKDVKVFNPAGTDNYYLDLNVAVPPFNDPQVVKAVNLAINRAEFVTKSGSGVGVPTTQPYQPGQVGYVGSYNPTYEPEQAKSILAAAGYKPGSISFIIPSSALYQAKAEVLQKQLQAIGITTEIQNLTDAQRKQLQFSHSSKYPLQIAGAHDYIDPLETFSQQFGIGGNANYGNRQPADFEPLLYAAQATPQNSPNYEKAVDAFAVAALNSGYKIYLYTYHYAYIQTKRLSDFPRTPGSVSWKGVTISPGK